MSIKCLFIGVWKDGTGWGNAAQNYILALDEAGIQVVPRAITLSKSKSVHIPERILELEKDDEQGSDVCIQHVLPDMMEYHGGFDQNIGMFASETSHFRNTNWAEKLNTMDQAWVFNPMMRMACTNSNVWIPVEVVPHCFDVSQYCQPVRPYPIPNVDGKFVFYTIGEVTRRKNLVGLLKAFHLEFSPTEPVALIIKGGVPGKSPAESSRILKSMIEEVKSTLRLYPSSEDYLNEILITQWLDNDEMLRLHNTGNCFVLPSYGEAWGIPGFEAMACGNPVILTDEGGPAYYVSNGNNGILIPARKEPVFIRLDEVAVPNIWISNENWSSPDLNVLRYQMRMVYENKEMREQLSSNGIDAAHNYSLQKVGQRMRDLLEKNPTQPHSSSCDNNTNLMQKHSLSFLGERS